MSAVGEAVQQHAGTRRFGLRRDVEGLRAVAILSVLAYHASIPFLPGGFVGVDVFFVISGFLITGLLVKEAERSGRISLANFYARRAKRLLPAAAVVFVFTAVGTALLFNGSEARAFGGDIVAAAAYVVNWRFAARAVDYLAEDTGQSPVLHFWSLSVEEQYYFVWPLLAILAIVVARRMGFHLRATMGVGLSVIAIPSFAWALYMGSTDAARAFFVTPTRMWELAAGAAIALAAPLLSRAPGIVGHVLGVAGAGAIVLSVVALHDTSVWPGAATLLPVLGTASVIAAGTMREGNVAARVLGVRPMVWVGGLSYSLYLWHWPLLLFADALWGPLRIREQVLVSVLAFVPAYLSLRFIENPVRFSTALAKSARNALAMGAVLTAVGLGAGIAVLTVHANTVPPAGSLPTDQARLWGAMALGDDPATSPAGDPATVPSTIIPAPADAPDDPPTSYEDGCQAPAQAKEPKYCEFGDVTSNYRILVLGDSKMFQYADALDAIGKRRGWHFTAATKSTCSWADATQSVDGSPYENCDTANETIERDMASDPPDAILTSGSPFHIWGEETTTDAERADALASSWARANALGIEVIALLETPRPPAGANVFECVDDNREDLMPCAYDRAQGVAESAAPSQVLAAQAVPGAAVVSVSDYVCPRELCSPVIGDVLVLRQGSHITNTYALTLVDVLGERLAAVIDNGEQRVGPTFVATP